MPLIASATEWPPSGSRTFRVASTAHFGTWFIAVLFFIWLSEVVQALRSRDFLLAVGQGDISELAAQLWVFASFMVVGAIFLMCSLNSRCTIDNEGITFKNWLSRTTFNATWTEITGFKRLKDGGNRKNKPWTLHAGSQSHSLSNQYFQMALLLWTIVAHIPRSALPESPIRKAVPPTFASVYRFRASMVSAVFILAFVAVFAVVGFRQEAGSIMGLVGVGIGVLVFGLAGAGMATASWRTLNASLEVGPAGLALSDIRAGLVTLNWEDVLLVDEYTLESEDASERQLIVVARTGCLILSGNEGSYEAIRSVIAQAVPSDTTLRLLSPSAWLPLTRRDD